MDRRLALLLERTARAASPLPADVASQPPRGRNRDHRAISTWVECTKRWLSRCGAASPGRPAAPERSPCPVAAASTVPLPHRTPRGVARTDKPDTVDPAWRPRPCGREHLAQTEDRHDP